MFSNWGIFKEKFFRIPELGMDLDLSRMHNRDNPISSERIEKMFTAMSLLEAGGIANDDENRQVGHYWLRNPQLAPQKDICQSIQDTVSKVTMFANQILAGTICGFSGKPFTDVLFIGIGGSVLGVRFITQALQNDSGLKTHFIDNTDPDGMDMVLQELKVKLSQTLVLVISKSGLTVEPMNGMRETEHFFAENGADFAPNAVAITLPDSPLEKIAKENHWLNCFQLWEWIGGRTSITSVVGLLPLALVGGNVSEFLTGARVMDELTRKKEVKDNPAALLVLSWYGVWSYWHHRQMVIIPYKDRLCYVTPYLQQLIMESLGKKKNRAGEIVHEGIYVWGSKGSTDQHSYMQQLLEGPDDFFLTFIEVLKDRKGDSIPVISESTSGDYLMAFLLGCRETLTKQGRQTITITLKEVGETQIGALVALYERAVGFYAELLDINAYNQPAVEMTKKSAWQAIELKNQVVEYLEKHSGQWFDAVTLNQILDADNQTEWIYRILRHLTENSETIKMREKDIHDPQKTEFSLCESRH